jgi:polar amino acid transport system substrate-binding protein
VNGSQHPRSFRLAARAAAVLGALAWAAVSQPARGEAGRALYTAAQAEMGAHQYAAYCVTCHGADLRGPQLPLKGAAFESLGETGMTLGQFFDFVVRDTPAGSMQSLTHEQYVEIMAYIMQQNGYASGDRPLRFDEALRSKTKITAQRATASR